MLEPTSQDSVPLSRPTGSPVVFFGRDCRLSFRPLQQLIDSGQRVAAVFMPAALPLARPIRQITRTDSGRLLPMAGRTASFALLGLAAKRDIPVFEIAELHSRELVQHLKTFSPELLVVSCFPERIPMSLVETAPQGGVNLHPSLLPQFRGPEPLFWIYRRGVRRSGVSVHRLTGRLDAGPVLGRRTFTVEPGLPGDQLEERCAQVGGDLLRRVVAELQEGVAHDRPQREDLASYYTWPDEDDLLIPSNWSAGRVLSFSRGVLPLGYAPLYQASTGTLQITGVVPTNAQSEPGTVRQLDQQRFQVGFLGGTLEFEADIIDT